MNKQYTVYLCPTNRCNLKCKHCYHSIVDSKTTISQQRLLNDVYNWLTKFADDHKDYDILIHLHGGEILQYDVKTIKQLIIKLRQYSNQFKFAITTNLVCKLTDDIIDLFNQIDDKIIQTSWDYKIRFANDKQYQLWQDNVKQLNQSFIVQPTICLTKQVISDLKPADIYDLMISLGCNRLNFERITNTGRAETKQYTPSNYDLNVWMVEAFKVYQQYKQQQKLVDLPLFDSIIKSVKGELIGCRARKCSEYVRTINPDGTIATCPNTCSIAVDCIDHSTDGQTSKHIQLIKKEQIRTNRCLSCQYFIYCNGDCWQLQQSSVDDNTMCHGPLLIYQYLVGG